MTKALTSQELGRRIDQALGRGRADLVIKGGHILNLATGTLDQGDVAICGAWIVGSHDSYQGVVEIDARGRIVAPGFIETEMTSELPDEIQQAILARIPQQRMGRADEVSDVVAFLATRGSYVNGTVVHVNGGMFGG